MPPRIGIPAAQNLYYLNHVGYKAVKGGSGQNIAVDEYYLNHVGYKDFFTSSAFIPISKYYLNHVGYKVFSRRRFLNEVISII